MSKETLGVYPCPKPLGPPVDGKGLLLETPSTLSCLVKAGGLAPGEGSGLGVPGLEGRLELDECFIADLNGALDVDVEDAAEAIRRGE